MVEWPVFSTLFNTLGVTMVPPDMAISRLLKCVQRVVCNVQQGEHLDVQRLMCQQLPRHRQRRMQTHNWMHMPKEITRHSR
jgi:type III secretory pathway component EscR